MRKKIVTMIVTIGFFASILGCGSMEEANTASVESVQANEDVMGKEPVKIVETEETASVDKAEVETAYNVEDYEEQKDIFVYKNIDSGDGTQIDFTNEEHVDGPFILSDSIDIYSYFFTYAGYTKPDIKINSVGRIGEWVFIPFAKSSFLVKAEDFDRVAVLKEKEEVNSAEKTANAGMESPVMAKETEEQKSVRTENSANAGNEVPVVSEAVPQTEAAEPAPAITTYSEEEVISIFRSTLESNGIQWYPSTCTQEELDMFGMSGGMGWGIENISMTDPYGDAAGTVEGFQFAGWNLYYLENQGSSDGYVHLKLYSGTN